MTDIKGTTEKALKTRAPRNSRTVEHEMVDAIIPMANKAKTLMDDLVAKVQEMAESATLQPKVNAIAKKMNSLAEKDLDNLITFVELQMKIFRRDDA